MKIKYLATALLATTLISTPLFAKDKNKYEPLVIKKGIDKSTPVNSSSETSTDEMEIAKKGESPKAADFGRKISVEGQAHRATVAGGGDSEELQSSKGYIKIGDIKGESTSVESDLNKDIDKASTKELKFGTRVSTEGQAHRATVTGGGDSEELQSSKGYIKIGDIKGNSTKASSAIPPSISGLEVTAPSQSAISDESNDGEESDCDDLKENERCVDGHVTVLK